MYLPAVSCRKWSPQFNQGLAYDIHHRNLEWRRPILHPHSLAVFLPCLFACTQLRVVCRFRLSLSTASELSPSFATLTYALCRWPVWIQPLRIETLRRTYRILKRRTSLNGTVTPRIETGPPGFHGSRSLGSSPLPCHDISLRNLRSHHPIPDGFNPTYLPSQEILIPFSWISGVS